jgi:hypothetical protein
MVHEKTGTQPKGTYKTNFSPINFKVSFNMSRFENLFDGDMSKSSLRVRRLDEWLRDGISD